MDSRAYWVGASLVKGIGAVRLQGLLDFFGDLESAWNAPIDGLKSAGLPLRVAENFIRVRSGVDLEKYYESILRKGIQVFIWEDEEYPHHLKQINQPPPVLYVRGTLTGADEVAVGVVGTRNVTVYGRQVTEELATCLGHHGVTLVSGLARGVDGVAHDACLKAGGRTLAVMGCGVDIIYPPEHRALAERILDSGALISDYAPGTHPDSANFPPRNRIISGLSIATVVVEAGETSGALITATFAAEQGRDVFAVPGGIFAPQSKGTNRLIRDGARPLLKVDEVLEALQIDQAHEHRQLRLALPADETEARLLNILSDQPTHIDEIGALAGLPIVEVSATLAMMELKGMVKQVGGMNFIVLHETLTQYRTDTNAK